MRHDIEDMRLKLYEYQVSQKQNIFTPSPPFPFFQLFFLVHHLGDQDELTTSAYT
jgi:hypothetical protein